MAQAVIWIICSISNRFILGETDNLV